MRCPICNKKLKKKETTCPSCHTKIVYKNIEVLEEPLQYKFKEIPLITKKINKPVKINFFRKTKNLYLAAIVVIFILGLTILLNKAVDNISYSKKEEVKEINSDEKTLFGNWQTENNSLFSFYEENSFYWYESVDNINENYYQGTYKYQRGLSALEEIGYDLKEFKNTFGENSNIEDLYSIEINIDKRISTLKEENKKIKWWYILIIDDTNFAHSYNKTLNTRYKLKKIIK